MVLKYISGSDSDTVGLTISCTDFGETSNQNLIKTFRYGPKR